MKNINFKIAEGKEIDYLINGLKKIKWKYWLNRPYSLFMATVFWEGINEKYFSRVSFSNIAPNNSLYQFPDIYYDEKFPINGVKFLENYFKKNRMSDLSEKLGKVHKHNIKKLKEAIKDRKKSIPEKTFILSDLVKDYMPFLWITIPLEEYFNNRIILEVPRRVKGDYSRFIGDISISKKKNVYGLMQDVLKSGVSIDKVQQKYGWMKSRDGFTDFYSIEELNEIKENIKEAPQEKVKIPKKLKNLSEELKELTFFRTDRTDKFYEYFGVARPLMIEIAKFLRTDFKELAFYDTNSIIVGQPKKYGKNFSYGSINNRYIISNKPIILGLNECADNEIKGSAAFTGVRKGIVKIITHPDQVVKVNQGDILVAQMTLPSFISAMQKASAFVTDEGGITCHAAIVSRELKKPCIIGTKIATKVLKDGDLVEVDANKGVVRIIKKS